VLTSTHHSTHRDAGCKAEGLNGKADFQRSGRVTLKGLDYYIDERIKDLTGGKQSPVSIAPSGVPDFPIAVLAN